MKMNLFLSVSPLLLFSAVSAFASGPNNVYGLSDRLEAITCLGAYATTMADAEKRIEPKIDAECGSISNTEEMDACAISIIKKLLPAVPGAIFTGNAVSQQKTFQMSILDNRKQIFKSIREGYHAQNIDDSISLMFPRVDTTADQYTITTGILSNDGNATPLLIVPIKRRVLSDLIYFFVDGCTLNWTKAS